ncbi:hypothetical protein T06_960 [Trichinella sp. T6]|nr:hypothetical protein T06_960 [Trichinella sp. T6]
MEKETYTIEKKRTKHSFAGRKEVSSGLAGRQKYKFADETTTACILRWALFRFAKSTLVSYCTSGDAAIALLSSAAFATRSTPIQPVSPAQIQPALVDPAFVYQ